MLLANPAPALVSMQWPISKKCVATAPPTFHTSALPAVAEEIILSPLAEPPASIKTSAIPAITTHTLTIANANALLGGSLTVDGGSGISGVRSILLLEGGGQVGLRRGGELLMWSDNAGSQAARMFLTINGQFVWKGASQTSATDTGVANVNTVSGAASFANGKIRLTSIGGYAIRLTNKTGGNTVAGQLVAPYSATAVDDAFKTQIASGDNTIGIILDAGVADGSEIWVIVSGIADVLIDAGGSARGDREISSATAGSADVWNVGGAVATHFLEIGHCIETRGGAGLARCVLHFN